MDLVILIAQVGWEQTSYAALFIGLAALTIRRACKLEEWVRETLHETLKENTKALQKVASAINGRTRGE